MIPEISKHVLLRSTGEVELLPLGYLMSVVSAVAPLIHEAKMSPEEVAARSNALTQGVVSATSVEAYVALESEKYATVSLSRHATNNPNELANMDWGERQVVELVRICPAPVPSLGQYMMVLSFEHETNRFENESRAKPFAYVQLPDNSLPEPVLFVHIMT